MRNKGLVASIVPYSLLVKTGDWHRTLLKNNRLLFVATMPPDAFQPYASFNTAVLVFQKGVAHANNSVFFARLANDGYKVKKNARVPQPGSQIATILDAYDKKLSIPEVTAYAIVNEKSREWSPEAFIASAPHSDEDFITGFEQSIRNHAAFFVGEGHRIIGRHPSGGTMAASSIFESQSKLSFGGTKLTPFNVSQYFDIKLGGKDEIEDLADDGNVAIVSTSEFNNGVTAWKHANRIYAPPAITVATDGSTCSSFVQEFPFYAFYKVAILRPKAGLSVPVDALYFVAYQLSLEKWRYVYARKFGKTRLSETSIYAPSKDGKPDFEKMAEITKQTAAYPIIASFRRAYQEFVSERFKELSSQWKKERRLTSSVARMAMNPAYQEIINLGIEVVPHILGDLAHSDDHWFIALNAITGAEPVAEKDRGRLSAMSSAWLAWGKERGYAPHHG